MKTYVLIRETGTYSDARTNVVGVYSSRDLALTVGDAIHPGYKEFAIKDNADYRALAEYPTTPKSRDYDKLHIEEYELDAAAENEDE